MKKGAISRTFNLSSLVPGSVEEAINCDEIEEKRRSRYSNRQNMMDKRREWWYIFAVDLRCSGSDKRRDTTQGLHEYRPADMNVVLPVSPVVLISEGLLGSPGNMRR